MIAKVRNQVKVLGFQGISIFNILTAIENNFIKFLFGSSCEKCMSVYLCHIFIQITNCVLTISFEYLSFSDNFFSNNCLLTGLFTGNSKTFQKLSYLTKSFNRNGFYTLLSNMYLFLSQLKKNIYHFQLKII